MILIDTGPLVALCNPRDEQHPRAMREVAWLGNDVAGISIPVFVEAHFFLPAEHQRQRLHGHLESGAFVPVEPAHGARCLDYALEWLKEYAEHEPDFADAWLISMADQARATIWTFDSEFETTWRTLDGAELSRVKRRRR